MRVIKWLGILVAAVVGLFLAGNLLMGWRTSARSSTLRAAVRAAGDPASIADLKPAPVPAGDNAAAQIVALTGAEQAFAKDYMQFLDRTELGKAYSQSEALPTAEQAAAMRLILDKHAAMRDGITRAAACERWACVGDFSLDHSLFMDQLMDRLQSFRGVIRYAGWELAVLATEGKRDAAVRRGIDMLKLARLHESEPTMVSYMVTAAVRGVAVHGIDKVMGDALAEASAGGAVSAEVRSELDGELARADQPGRFGAVLRSERAVTMDFFPASVGTANSVLVRLFGWHMQRHYVDADESMTEVIALADGPWSQFRQAMKLSAGGKQPTGHGVVADLLAPGFLALVETRDRDLALLRSLRVLNALAGFAQRNGREAGGILDVGLPVDAVLDPYRGTPLVAKRTDRGWVVYSVGENEKDDGGAFAGRLDVGVGMRAADEAAATVTEK